MKGFLFDVYNKYEKPDLILATPNKQETAIIVNKNFKNLNLILRFNAISEISFTIFNKIVDLTGSSIDNPYYELVKKNKLIFLNDIGWFVINTVDENIEGNKHMKQVSCYSFEYTLNSKSINLLNGTYKFYNEVNPYDEKTLLGKIMSALPNWTLGKVDPTLWNKYRTFDIPDTTVYGFLMNDVEKAYECIFDFDTINQKINIIAPKNIVKNTDIVLNNNVLLKNVSIKENDDDIITALAVFGGGTLDIRNVNPLGSAFIYNFNYYKTSEWMSHGLINAINNWENKISYYFDTYNSNLTQLKIKNNELLGLNINLTDLEGQLKALEVAQGQQITEPVILANVIKDTYNKIVVKKSEIFVEKNKIKSKENEIKNIQLMLKNINVELSFTNNFTQQQLMELNDFVFTGAFRNENYIQTDEMTIAEIQDMSIQLLEQGINTLNKVSQPRYTFTMKASNFLFIQKFKPFIDQLELGCLINAEIKEDEWVMPILLELNIDYDNPENFTMVFGNRFRLDSAEWTFSDLYNDSNRVISNVNVNSDIWSRPVKSGLIDEVSNYINSSLSLANQLIVNSEKQNFTLGEYGLRGTKVNDDGTIDPHQVWMNNHLLCMTDDNWQTSKLAIGIINGKSSVIADVIAGRLMAGNDLLITNENNHFKVDANGAELINAKFTLTTANNKGKIILDPEAGIKIQSGNGYAWKDIFYIDMNDGILKMEGQGIFNSGSIGGWRIDKTGLYNDNNGDYLGSNGNGKISLLTYTPNSATFDGNIYAKNLKAGYNSSSNRNDGYINNGHFDKDSINGDHILVNGSVGSNKLSAEYKDGVISSIASVEAKADANGASIVLFAEWRRDVVTPGLEQHTRAISSLEIKADANEASITSLTEYTNKEISKVNGIIETTSTTLREQISTAKEAAIKDSTSYTDSREIIINGKIAKDISEARTSIEQASNDKYATITMMAEYTKTTDLGTVKSISDIKMTADSAKSDISLSASYGSNTIGSNVRALLQLVANADSSSIQIKADKIDITALKLPTLRSEDDTHKIHCGDTYTGVTGIGYKSPYHVFYGGSSFSVYTSQNIFDIQGTNVNFGNVGTKQATVSVNGTLNVNGNIKIADSGAGLQDYYGNQYYTMNIAFGNNKFCVLGNDTGVYNAVKNYTIALPDTVAKFG